MERNPRMNDPEMKILKFLSLKQENALNPQDDEDMQTILSLLTSDRIPSSYDNDHPFPRVDSPYVGLTNVTTTNNILLLFTERMHVIHIFDCSITLKVKDQLSKSFIRMI